MQTCKGHTALPSKARELIGNNQVLKTRLLNRTVQPGSPTKISRFFNQSSQFMDSQRGVSLLLRYEVAIICQLGGYKVEQLERELKPLKSPKKKSFKKKSLSSLKTDLFSDLEGLLNIMSSMILSIYTKRRPLSVTSKISRPMDDELVLKRIAQCEYLLSEVDTDEQEDWRWVMQQKWYETKYLKELVAIVPEGDVDGLSERFERLRELFTNMHSSVVAGKGFVSISNIDVADVKTVICKDRWRLRVFQACLAPFYSDAVSQILEFTPSLGARFIKFWSTIQWDGHIYSNYLLSPQMRRIEHIEKARSKLQGLFSTPVRILRAGEDCYRVAVSKSDLMSVVSTSSASAF